MQWTALQLCSIVFRLSLAALFQDQVKANTKAPRHWRFWGEFTGDRWIPAQRASNAENVSIWSRQVLIMYIVWSTIYMRSIFIIVHTICKTLHRILNEKNTNNLPSWSDNIYLESYIIE